MPPSLLVTKANVAEVYDHVFAPWVKEIGLTDFEASEGRVAALLPSSEKMQFAGGAVCGQALMAAIDTVVALAMMTTDRATKGTIYQHTHFLRPALGEAFHIDAKVLRFGKTTAFAQARVTNGAGDLIAHSTAEFAF